MKNVVNSKRSFPLFEYSLKHFIALEIRVTDEFI